jgi:hypothetical protein
LLREDHGAVDDNVELTMCSGLGNGRVRRRPVDLGRETRGPFVVAASDGAVKNVHGAHRCAER